MPLFTVTIFLAAVLLFVVEPMFVRMVLPLLGGTPAVWVTCVLVYQALLLAGYAYAHLSVSRLGPRRQAGWQAALVFLPILLLPIAVPAGWIPPRQGDPGLWLIAVMTVSVAFPFFVISSISPLLQRWFASTSHPRAHDPYFLFRASNLGSMIGLIAYPVLLEPTLRLAGQSRLWTVGYVLLAVLAVSCAMVVRHRPRGAETSGEGSRDSALPASPPTTRRRLRWLALAFAPASLMLGVTSFITTDIAPIPLLWVVPLGLYLASFVIAFSPRYQQRRALVMRAVPILVLALLWVMLIRATGPLWLLICLHLLVLFLASVMCHGEFAIDRPPPQYLTAFYLWISFGGVLGGVFNAVVAPLLFESFAEYPLAIAAACALLPSRLDRPARSLGRVLDVAVPVILGVAVLFAAILARRVGSSVPHMVAVACLPLLYLSLRARPALLGLTVGALLLVSASPRLEGQQVLAQDRSFFGVYRVMQETGDEPFRLLIHGTTVHGAQSLDPASRLEPTSYFTRSGPIGDVFESWTERPSGARIGVIGLGTGSLACYGRPGEWWTFFEIDPVIERIARDPSLFTFLRDCPGEHDVVLGDGRLSLQGMGAASFDMLVVDAFSSDAIPVHLITREAVAMYRSKLAPDGLLVFHISNRYLDLHPVLGSLAEAAGLVSIAKDDDSVTDIDRTVWKVSSSWVVMSRSASGVAWVARMPGWYQLTSTVEPWTDDYSNILGVVRWGRS